MGLSEIAGTTGRDGGEARDGGSRQSRRRQQRRGGFERRARVNPFFRGARRGGEARGVVGFYREAAKKAGHDEVAPTASGVAGRAAQAVGTWGEGGRRITEAAPCSWTRRLHAGATGVESAEAEMLRW